MATRTMAWKSAILADSAPDGRAVENAGRMRARQCLCCVAIQRTEPARACIARVCVWTPSASDRTPRSNAPPLMPVAEKTISPCRQFLGAILALRVKPAVPPQASLIMLSGRQPRLHLSAHAAQRRRGDQPFRRAAHAHVDVEAGEVRARRFDHGGDIAVADKPHSRAGLAQRGDQRAVTRAVEHAGGEILRLDTLSPGQCAADSRRATRPDRRSRPGIRADRDLVHVDVGHAQQAAGRPMTTADSALGSALAHSVAPSSGLIARSIRVPPCADRRACPEVCLLGFIGLADDDARIRLS